MKKSVGETKKVKNWSYAEASKTVKYIRGCLGDLRVSVIRLKYLYRAANFNRKALKNDSEVGKLQDLGKKTFAEFDQAGIVLYDKSYRGIALYPFVVLYDDGTGKTPREAYYVYKDTRDGIDNYIFKDELEAYGDMAGWEKPVPAAWRAAGVEPVIDAYAAK